MQARSSFSGYAGKLCCLFSRLEFETLWFISTPLGCLLEQTEVRPQSARRFICFSVFWVQLLPTANPGGSCKKGVRLTLPRPGVQIVVLVVGFLGYRHTVTQERDHDATPVKRRRDLSKCPNCYSTVPSRVIRGSFLTLITTEVLERNRGFHRF